MPQTLSTKEITYIHLGDYYKYLYKIETETDIYINLDYVNL